MDNQYKDKVEKALRKLRQQYITSLPEKLDNISSIYNKIKQQTIWNNEDLVLCHRMVHSISGSGATFGLTDLSTAAQRLERELKPLLTLEAPILIELQRSIDQLFIQLWDFAIWVKMNHPATNYQMTTRFLFSTPFLPI